jgi:tetratricopeptide (TPR) repeat protein
MTSRGHLIHKFKPIGLLILLVASLIAPGLVQMANAQPAYQNNAAEPVHLVVGFTGDLNSIRFNKATWKDFSTTNPIQFGMPLQTRDYIAVSGTNSLVVLCSNLTLVTVVANGVPDCPRGDSSTFLAMDSVIWNPEDFILVITPQSIPPTGAITDGPVLELEADEVEQLGQKYSAIGALNLPDDTALYVVAYLMASQGLYWDAVNTLEAVESLQCQRNDPTIEVDEGESIAEYAPLYLHLGEWYGRIMPAGNNEPALRYLTCAFELAQATDDHYTLGLAASRLAVLLANDPLPGGLISDETQAQDAVGFYQQAITAFSALSAEDATEELVEACAETASSFDLSESCQ